MPNIQDVAKLAGFSTATVSRALNTPDKVARCTLQRIRSAIEELHYDPEDNRKSMQCGSSRKILVVIPDFSNEFFNDILAGINEACLRAHYSMLVVATNTIMERERESMNLLYNRQADGVIFLSPLLSDQELASINAHYPLVQCCEYSEQGELTHVSIDNYAASHEAVEFLIKLGHTRIAFLSSSNRFVSTKLRDSAYHETLSAHGISLPHGYLQKGSYAFLSGYENMQHLIKLPVPPTAVLAISDTVAAGAMRAAFDAGLSVPGDVAVMGFDNINLCTMMNPTLTTIAQPRKRIGMTAVEMLLNKIEGQKEQRILYLPHELISRGSTR